MFQDSSHDGVDVGEGFFRSGGVGDFEAVVFFEGDDELKGVDGIQPQAAGTEKSKVVSNFFGALLKHQVFDKEFFYVRFELVDVVHGVRRVD